MNAVTNVELEKHVKAIKTILRSHDNLPFESAIEDIAMYIRVRCELAETKGFVSGTVESLDVVKISTNFFGCN